MRPRRADAARNYDQLVAAAAEAFAREGAEASLEEIARRAGVGSATLHRHFPSRQALLTAVFHDRVEALCRQARESAGSAEPGTALTGWLRSVGASVAGTRGLASSLVPGTDNACHLMMAEAGDVLLTRARRAGAVRAEVSIGDLLTLVVAISMTVEHRPGADGSEAERLLGLAIDGIRQLRQG
ncbi:TetR/AcrR family transcriptional regulator [Actinoplanes sp. NPDC049599]|uniref:TetR/AcrR family transcriptional regulator n=1 Tax=Actinoplanes sp. NPDC049599 TaxID=3363903 RepID=UPI00379774DA